MDVLDLEVTLIPAHDDPPLKAAEYQEGLREFNQCLNAAGLEFSYSFEVLEAWAPEPAPTKYLGDFVIKLAAIIGPALGTGIGAWLHARYGRRVRLKIGDIEAEAQTIEEVEQLLARVQEIQERSQPRVIRES
jgi:hypothetical protein